MAESSGSKRPYEDTLAETSPPSKKRKVHRVLQHVQYRPQHIEPAPQDPVFVQGQLLRSITAALAVVGFDSAQPTALETFRAAVEEYMLQFLHYARTSVRNSRRTQPTAMDFASALALIPNTSSASLLKPQLNLRIPEQISYPAIPEPDAPPAPPPDFSALLQPLVTSDTPKYIPKHFPHLPPQHAWKRTPVFPQREHDARKMRERATEEGLLAEQALRKLAAAAKSGAVKAERRRENTLSGIGRKVGGKEQGRASRKEPVAEDMYGDMLKEVEGVDAAAESEAMDLGVDGVNELREEGIDPGMPEGVVVNWDRTGWRRGGRKHFQF